MSTLYPRVLFFISSTTPSPSELEEANNYGPGVAFRNANLVPDDGPIEEADAVAGVVPQRYADALPNVRDREKVRTRLNLRAPGSAMFGPNVVKRYDELTDEEKELAVANGLSRGAQPLTVNERIGAPLPLEHRTNQAGERHYTPTMPADGWNTGAKQTDEPAGTASPAEGTETADEAKVREAAAKARESSQQPEQPAPQPAAPAKAP